MNAIYESFSEHSETSTYDIAFLTVSEISAQIGVSKSKLYKDIREGKLLAEKSLDETLVVSPKALQQAYRQIDLSKLIDSEFPVPDFIEEENDLADATPKEDCCANEPVDTSSQQACETVSCHVEQVLETQTPQALSDTWVEQSSTEESNPKTPSGSQKARIIGLASVVAICSAILMGVIASI